MENDDPEGWALVREVYPKTGRAAIIGFTGPPGVGKSTLIGRLVEHARAREREVAVLSIDPSSPFTKGALLGDRIRLSDHFLDPGVFIRSMASRGSLGGLSEATLQAALLMDASGKDDVFLETVGVGQAEVDIIDHADTVVLVLMPGSGDSIQALKAGVMEIPDVIVVNKSDHPLTDTMMREIRGVLSLGPQEGWRVPILKTEASRGEGIEELAEKIAEHREHIAEQGTLDERRRRNLMNEVMALAGGAAAAPARGAGARGRVGAGAARRGGGSPPRPGVRRGAPARARGIVNPGRARRVPSRAFRLQRDEPVGKGIARMAHGRIIHALEELGGATDSTPEEAVHEARKDVKKLRALLRLVRSSTSAKVRTRENEALRDVGRSLSGKRDADVMLATLAGLEDLPPDVAARLRAQLEEHRSAMPIAPTDAAALELTRIREQGEDVDAARRSTSSCCAPGSSAGTGAGSARSARRGAIPAPRTSTSGASASRTTGTT